MLVGIEAEAADVILHVLRADRLQDADRYHILGLGEPGAHRHGAFVLAVVVVRLPHLPAGQEGIDDNRGIVDNGRRRKALFERGRVYERLERGTGLAPGLGHVVELVAIEIEAADERTDRSVLGIERDERRLRVRNLHDLPAIFFLLGDANNGAAPDTLV